MQTENNSRRRRDVSLRRVAEIAFYAIVLVALMLMIGAALHEVLQQDATEVLAAGGRLTRMIDAQAGVVCWVPNSGDGLSCLPISQTSLEEADLQ